MLFIVKNIKQRHREIEYPFSRDLHFFYTSMEHLQKSVVCLVTKKKCFKPKNMGIYNLHLISTNQ